MGQKEVARRDGSTKLQTKESRSNNFAEMIDVPQSVSGVNVDFIVLTMIVVAFLPTFLDSRFYESIPRLITMVLLGVGYGATAVFLTRWHEARLKWWSGLTYFGIQTSIILALFIFGIGINDNFWLLMLPLVGQGFSLGMWRGAVGIALLQLAVMAGFVLYNSRDSLGPELYQDLFFTTVSIGSAMLFVMIFTFLALREGDTREKMTVLATDLHEANQRLAAYAEQVEELATTRERNRLAREIHDNLGHYLTVVNVQIEAARTVMEQDAEKADGALAKAQRLTQEGLASVRQSVSALREAPWEGRSFADALNGLIEESRSAGLPVSFVVNGVERPLSPKITHTLYRTVQEGLTNVRKYAGETAVAVNLDYTNTHTVTVEIQDNGKGTDSPEGGFGLLGLRERVALLNGKLTITTQPNSGFTLTVMLPTDQS